MFNKIKQQLTKLNLERVYCILFLIISILTLFLTDIKETNNLITFYTHIILVFITGGISTIKNEIRNLVKDEGKWNEVVFKIRRRNSRIKQKNR